jgi:hypothetical protein
MNGKGDYSAAELRVARILLRYREAVAQAAEKACSDLRDLGVADPVGLLLGNRSWAGEVPGSRHAEATRR